jgi:hypothetical protein
MKDPSYHREQAEFKCRCPGGNCIGHITGITTAEFRKSFWGPVKSGLWPSMTQRREKIRKILDAAFAKGQLHKTDTFIFQIDGKVVCENGFVAMLGFNYKDKPRMWKEVRSRVEMGKPESTTEISPKIRVRGQRAHARSYIIRFVKRECDKLPHKEVAIVPYVHIKTFWMDYDFAFKKLLITGKVGGGQIAAYKTFKRAFKELKGDKQSILTI